METLTTNKSTQSVPPPKNKLLNILEGIEGVLIIIACYLTIFLHKWRSHWGISAEDALKPFPADDIVPNPKTHFTHAIEINAPANKVWPWIAQIGKDRGGFYTYVALENIIGLDIHNSDVIIPELQHPKLGEQIPFGGGSSSPIAVFEEGQAMAIENSLNMDNNQPFSPKSDFPENYLHLTWLWYVEPIDQYRSRFISRNRVDYSPSFKNRLMFGLAFEPVVFAMDRKMCLGIKKRAEKLNRYQM